MQLFLAALAGRLWWSATDSFALLEPPSDHQPPNRAARRLRFLNHYWELLVLFTPLAVLMVIAAGLVLVPTAPTRLAGLLLLAFDVTVAVVMVLLVTLGGLRWLFGVVEPARWKHDNSAIDAYLDEHWSVPLCHIREATAAGDGMRALHHWDDSVLVQESGVTESRTLAAIRGAATPLGSENSGVLVVHRSARRQLPVPDARPLGEVTLLAAVTVGLPFVMAGMIAGWEQAACGEQDCTGQLSTYGRALYWLFYQYFWTDPPGLAPLSTQARVLGPELRVLILVVVVTLVVTAVRYTRWRKKEIEKVSTAALAHKTTTLVLVASAVERDVLAAPHDLRPRLGRRVASALGAGRAGYRVAGCDDADRQRPDHRLLSGLRRARGHLLRSQEGRAASRRPPRPHPAAQSELDEGRASGRRRVDRVRPGRPRVIRRPAGPLPRGHRGLVRRPRAFRDPAVGKRRGRLAGVRTQLREREPDALGAEMEGTGVYAAAARSKVDWIIVKGIAGWGRQATDESQATAAKSAADFLVHLLQIGALGGPGGEPAADPPRDPAESPASPALRTPVANRRERATG